MNRPSPLPVASLFKTWFGWNKRLVVEMHPSHGVPPLLGPTSPGSIEAMDSLSYVSGDDVISPSSNEESARDTGSPMMKNIVCRDCFAPPGKLLLVIHSTKDGPAVHTVKPGSSLEGSMFPGDLIVAVDNVDTRALSAEAVMKMMASRSEFERKVTVLHFEDK